MSTSSIVKRNCNEVIILEGAGTRKGKLSTEAALRGGKKSKHGKTSTVTYHVTFVVEAEFGTPGAVAVKNGNRADQFFLRHVRLELAHDRSIHFECNSWVYPYKKTNSDRLFFINTVWNSVTHLPVGRD
jgi:lipoxygenase